jgi:hypothetical protein
VTSSPSPSPTSGGHPDYTPTVGPPSGEPGAHGFVDPVHIIGSGLDLIYVVEEPLAGLWQVKVDDVPLTAGVEYLVREGSTVATLQAAYLDTLTIGQHEIRAEFAEAIAEDVFYVQAAATASPSASPTPKPAPSTALPGTGAGVSWPTVLWSFAALGIGGAMMMVACAIQRRPVARRRL